MSLGATEASTTHEGMLGQRERLWESIVSTHHLAELIYPVHQCCVCVCVWVWVRELREPASCSLTKGFLCDFLEHVML